MTDTQGHLLHVKVHAANIHDTKTGGSVFKEALDKYPSFEGVSADEGYRKTTENFVQHQLKKQRARSKLGLEMCRDERI